MLECFLTHQINGGLMDINIAIEELKKYIYNSYKATSERIGPNIYRGHLRSLSTEIEDGIALFVSIILPKCKIFLDPSIHIDRKNNRPDLLVVNENNEVVAMIEIKSNMGWCRNAKGVIDGIINNDNKLSNAKSLYCEFSRESSQIVTYGNNVKLFLIALTDGNCSAKNHVNNKAYAATTKVKQYNLFSGWYDKLFDCEVAAFAAELMR